MIVGELQPAILEDPFTARAINDAFQDAMQGVLTDHETAYEEKVRRMEAIITIGSSNTYREFVDFRVMASQIEACAHDHAMHDALNASELITDFRTNNREHGHGQHHDHDDEKDNKKSKKKKKKRGWLYILLGES